MFIRATIASFVGLAEPEVAATGDAGLEVPLPAPVPTPEAADLVREEPHEAETLSVEGKAHDTREKGAVDGQPRVASGAQRRVALVVGANDGGRARATLRYATSDATTLADVLSTLGGLRELDIVRLRDPSPEEFGEAFERVAHTVAELSKGSKVQFIFYYSGHSDENGLLLGEQRIGYRDLRTLVDSVDADVRIAILDSCASGAFTRLKGGNKTAPLLVTSMTDVKGHAFLTSSSETEAAQESDRIGGSFFTHYLTTGLRGAADANGDRLITLNEAYQFAFYETLARTESTQAGPQHAAYEIQLSGTGDLVMTDLRRTTGRLTLTEGLHGRIAIRNAKGFLSAELYKSRGSAPVLLALEPGPYRVTLDDGAQLRMAEVNVTTSGSDALEPVQLVMVPQEQTIERGSMDTTRHIPFNIGLVPALSINGRSRAPRITNAFSISVFWSRATALDGVALALGMTIVEETVNGAQLGLIGNLSPGHTKGAQLTLGFNYAQTLKGAQIGLVNRANELPQGIQLGLVNTTDASSGVQVGALNTAGRGSTVQIGIVNYGKEADAQLGIFNVTKEGNVHPEVWTSDIAVAHLGLRFPARYTYSILAAGLAPLENHKAWLFGAGFGGHIPLPKRFFVDIDLTSWAVSSGLQFQGPWGLLARLQVMPGWQLVPRVSMFLGPSLNVLIDRFADSDSDANSDLTPDSEPDLAPDTSRDVARPGYGWVQYDSDANRGRVRIWLGFSAGLRF